MKCEDCGCSDRFTHFEDCAVKGHPEMSCRFAICECGGETEIFDNVEKGEEKE